MKPQFSISIEGHDRTIRLRMSGLFDLDAMDRFYEDYKRKSSTYAGTPHLILADLRGMSPSSPEVAARLGEVIEYSRQIGAVCCAHLSDDTVTQLQAARLGRMASPHSDVSVDVVSRDEAEKVLSEARGRLAPLRASSASG